MAAAGTVVDAQGKDTKTDAARAASIQKNLDAQKATTPVVEKAKRVFGLGQFSPISENDNFIDVAVDADTALNTVNKDGDNVYFRTVVNNLLSPLDYNDSNGILRRCISIARHTIGIVRESSSSHSLSSIDKLEIVPDSGATSTMRKRKSDFEEDSYTPCNDVFVLMGDGHESPVAGYGTSRMKIDGHVTRILNSLHVPGLDCDLFSTTRHGRNGKGCSFLLGDSKMHLTFPKFSITQDILEDGDLRIKLQDLDTEDWGIPNFVCDGIEETDEHFENFNTRMHFLNQIFKGRAVTRAQRKKQIDDLKHALGGNHARDSLDSPSSSPEQDSPGSPCSPSSYPTLPDNYLCEGSPDKMMLEALKELNINDIKDFLKNNEPPDKQFEKQDRAPPPQYHLESSRGDVKDRLTAYNLQTYFGGKQLKDFSLLSKLGTGLSVIDNDQDLTTIGELVNCKRGKC